MKRCRERKSLKTVSYIEAMLADEKNYRFIMICNTMPYYDDRNFLFFKQKCTQASRVDITVQCSTVQYSTVQTLSTSWRLPISAMCSYLTCTHIHWHVRTSFDMYVHPLACTYIQRRGFIWILSLRVHLHLNAARYIPAWHGIMCDYLSGEMKKM